jgi:hypothetical protein
MLNTKRITIDIDSTKVIKSTTNATEDTLLLYRGTDYVLQANVIASVSNSNAFAFTTTDQFVLAIGKVYGSNASPVLTTKTGWNNVADWAITDPEDGKLSCHINTTSSVLTSELGSSSQKSYIMEIWCINENEETTLLSQSDVTIRNIVVE